MRLSAIGEMKAHGWRFSRLEVLLEHICPLIPQLLISALYNPIPMCSHDDVKCDGGGVYSLCEWSSCHAIVSREDSNRVTTERLRRMICLHFHLHMLIIYKEVHHILLFSSYTLKTNNSNSPKAIPHQSVWNGSGSSAWCNEALWCYSTCS